MAPTGWIDHGESGYAGRNLARRSRHSGEHAKRRGSAGGRLADSPPLRPGWRVHSIGHHEGRPAAAGAIADQSARCFLRHHTRSKPFLIGEQWRGPLCIRSALPGCRRGSARPTRQLIAGDASIEEPTSWHQVIGATEALSTDYQHHAGIYTAGEKLLAVDGRRSEDQRRFSPMFAFRNCSRAWILLAWTTAPAVSPA